MRFLLLVLLLSACVPLPTPCPVCDCQCPEPEPCEDYVRWYLQGVYSLCMILNAESARSGGTRFVDCVELVKVAHDLKWHELDAPGFEWPPEETSGLDNTARNYVK